MLVPLAELRQWDDPNWSLSNTTDAHLSFIFQITHFYSQVWHSTAKRTIQSHWKKNAEIYILPTKHRKEEATGASCNIFLRKTNGEFFFSFARNEKAKQDKDQALSQKHTKQPKQPRKGKRHGTRPMRRWLSAETSVKNFSNSQGCLKAIKFIFFSASLHVHIYESTLSCEKEKASYLHKGNLGQNIIKLNFYSR